MVQQKMNGDSTKSKSIENNYLSNAEKRHTKIKLIFTAKFLFNNFYQKSKQKKEVQF